MSDYVLPHSNPEEEERLTLMSQMLDPHMCFRLEQIGIGPGWNCLEVASGNGSVSTWLADKVGPSGHVVISDIDTTYLDRLAKTNLEVKKLDVTVDDLGGEYDLVCGRAFLHHIPERLNVVKRLADAVKPGGYILIVEPDFHPSLTSDSPIACMFFEGFLAWAANQGIDYYIGRRLGLLLRKAQFDDIRIHGETILFNGGSLVSRYWQLTMAELGEAIMTSGAITRSTMNEALALLDDPDFWAWQNSYVATSARKPK